MSQNRSIDFDNSDCSSSGSDQSISDSECINFPQNIIFRFQACNGIEVSFEFIIAKKDNDNKITYSSQICTSCLCCVRKKFASYRTTSIEFETLEQLIENLPIEEKNEIKNYYIWQKKQQHKATIFNQDILTSLTDIKHNDLVCHESDCNWSGSDKLSICPSRKTRCPQFPQCSTRIKVKKIDQPHQHMCSRQLCDFVTSSDYDFQKHIEDCIYRTVRCNLCFWKGKYISKDSHISSFPCINNSVNRQYTTL